MREKQMSEEDDLQIEDVENKQIESPPKKYSTGCWLSAMATILAVAGGLYGLSIYLAPEIPDELTESVQISIADENSKPSSVESWANSITASITAESIAAAEHPLDPLLRVARQGLKKIDADVRDYTAIMQKQVRIDGELGDEGFMKCKVRHGREQEDVKIPFSVYTYFLKPASLAGQEAIWVEGANDGKLVAHAHGLLNVKRFWLVPTESLAMKGNLHPITEMGIRNLIKLMIEKGTRDRKHGECEVTVTRNVDVGGHTCTLIQVKHPEKRDHFEFHIANIYIDDERNLPIAYEGFLWPENPGDEPPLLEKYFYKDIEINVGLSDEDFDPSNSEYNYPRW